MVVNQAEILGAFRYKLLVNKLTLGSPPGRSERNPLQHYIRKAQHYISFNPSEYVSSKLHLVSLSANSIFHLQLNCPFARRADHLWNI